MTETPPPDRRDASHWAPLEFPRPTSFGRTLALPADFAEVAYLLSIAVSIVPVEDHYPGIQKVAEQAIRALEVRVAHVVRIAEQGREARDDRKALNRERARLRERDAQIARLERRNERLEQALAALRRDHAEVFEWIGRGIEEEGQRRPREEALVILRETVPIARLERLVQAAAQIASGEIVQREEGKS